MSPIAHENCHNIKFDRNGLLYNNVAYKLTYEPNNMELLHNSLAIEFTSSHSTEHITEVPLEINNDFLFINTYPNPFNPKINIIFKLFKNEYINIKVFDINGQVVEKIIDQLLLLGVHTITWNAEGIPSGIYFIQLKNSSNQIQNMKVSLVR